MIRDSLGFYAECCRKAPKARRQLALMGIKACAARVVEKGVKQAREACEKAEKASQQSEWLLAELTTRMRALQDVNKKLRAANRELAGMFTPWFDGKTQAPYRAGVYDTGNGSFRLWNGETWSWPVGTKQLSAFEGVALYPPDQWRGFCVDQAFLLGEGLT